jgi:O-methyltransferase involved in polyketide biosynthesis
MFDVVQFDTTKPNIARVYDYMLGGKDNFAADRELADRMCKIDPGLPRMARANRDFLTAAVRRAAEAGIGQFLDLGAGLPTRPAVHHTVREVNQAARVAYVDNDPVVVTHASALLAAGPGVVVAGTDLANPGEVLDHPTVTSVIDLGEPVCVILASVLHFIDPETAGTIVAGYIERVPAGSWIVVSVGTTEDMDLLDRARGSYTLSAWNHGPREIAAWLDGLDLVPPGMAEARRWASGIGGVPPSSEGSWYLLCAAAVKP